MAREPRDPWKPAELQRLDNGMLALWWGDMDDFVDELEDADLQGGGYGWEAVLAPALQKRDPEAYAAIEFSPEADTFVAIAKDEAPLKALAKLLRELTKDDDARADAIASADQDRS